METPIIVISSPRKGTGKTTLALNLAAALWSDGYKVGLFAPQNPEVKQFMEQRQILRSQSRMDLPMPYLLEKSDLQADSSEKTVVIADIPTANATDYADIFAKAHTLITVGQTADDFDWQLTHPYVNLVWEAKKNIAARGIKYLNWIAVVNQTVDDDGNIKGYFSIKDKNLRRRSNYRAAPFFYFLKSNLPISEYSRNRAPSSGFFSLDLSVFIPSEIS